MWDSLLHCDMYNYIYIIYVITAHEAALIIYAIVVMASLCKLITVLLLSLVQICCRLLLMR